MDGGFPSTRTHPSIWLGSTSSPTGLTGKNGVHFKMWHHEGYHGTPDAVFPNNWFARRARPLDEVVIWFMNI